MLQDSKVNLHDGAPGPHLRHHAAGAPHVDRGAVVPLPEQQFRRAVPGDKIIHRPMGPATAYSIELINVLLTKG